MTGPRGLQAYARRYPIAVAIAIGGSAVAGQAAWGNVVTIQLATLASPSPSDTVGTLPVSQTVFEPGATLYIEVWAQTTQTNGLSSVSADLLYSNSLLNVSAITHTALFGVLTHGSINNANGLVDDLSGSHLGPCSNTTGVAPNWARVAVLQSQAIANGAALIQPRQSSSPVYGTAICGLGDVPLSQISYQNRTITITSLAVPAVSAWGMILLALSLIIAATTVLRFRSLPRDTGRRARRHQSGSESKSLLQAID